MGNDERQFFTLRGLSIFALFVVAIATTGLVYAVYSKTPSVSQSVAEFNQSIAQTNASINANSITNPTTGSTSSTTSSTTGNQIAVWGDSMVSNLQSLGSFQNTATTFIGKNGENASQVASLLPSITSAAGSNLTKENTIIWFGDSSIPGNTEVSNVNGITSLVKSLNGGANQKILILPSFNGGFNPLNANSVDLLKFSFPNYYFDLRTMFVKEAKSWFRKTYPAQYAATWKLPCPQQTCANPAQGSKTDSSWDVKNNIPPRALRSDANHLNQYGNQLVKDILTKELIKLGWIN